MTDESLSMTSIRTNGVSLYQGLNHTDFDMWLLRDSDQVTVYAYYDGEGFLAVQGLRICRTNAWNRMLLFIMVCLFTVINVVCLYWGYDKKYSIPVKSKTVTFCLGLIILFASLPMTLDYVTGGGRFALSSDACGGNQGWFGERAVSDPHFAGMAARIRICVPHFLR